MPETQLYAPVKAMLERQGYVVKSEISDCDLVAVRGNEAPVVVELKLRLSLGLIMQGIDRQAITDWVYVAVPHGKGGRWRAQIRDMGKLCRRLGLGLITVRLGAQNARARIYFDPAPYRPRRMAARKTALLCEFERRVGDPNTGGQTRRPVVTAYRQDALRIAMRLAAMERSRPVDLARDLAIPGAASILQKNHYGWFDRVSRGVYCLSPKGEAALLLYGDMLASLRSPTFG